MNTHFHTSSRLGRFLAAVASCIVTSVLFGAVVIGLTSEHGAGQLAQAGGHLTATSRA